MRKLRTFFYVFIKSITNPRYYPHILKTKFSFSLKYVAFFALLLSLVPTVKAIIAYKEAFPAIAVFQKQIEEGGENWYPKELVVTVRDGVVSTNVKEPYVIDFPFEMSDAGATDIIHFITIDTKATAENFTKYQSFIVVGKTIVYMQDDKGYKFYPVSDMKDDLVIDKALYDEWMAKVKPYIEAIPTIARWGAVVVFLLLPFLIASGALIVSLVYLGLLSVLVLILARLMKRTLRYGEVYRLGMHGATGPIIAELIGNALGLKMSFLYDAYFFVWMGVVLAQFPRRR